MNTNYRNGVGLDARQGRHEDIDQWRPFDMATGILWIVIPYTTLELTKAALRHAAVCSDLDLQIVPFPGIWVIDKLIVALGLA